MELVTTVFKWCDNKFSVKMKIRYEDYISGAEHCETVILETSAMCTENEIRFQ